ncbi:MAG TPA: DUF1778 domain-containing protein [Sporichthyaceae bacterium]|jgi:uncharacterized protein (DUF1778 family)|nr:DUF1778 domain-containing protein [Sporichthyaceae bacterium]
MAEAARRRDERLSLRATAEERRLIQQAAAVSEVDVTTFVLGNALAGARQVLADRDRFVLDADAAAAWESVNDRPARKLPGLAALMKRPSPFVD